MRHDTTNAFGVTIDHHIGPIDTTAATLTTLTPVDMYGRRLEITGCGYNGLCPVSGMPPEIRVRANDASAGVSARYLNADLGDLNAAARAEAIRERERAEIAANCAYAALDAVQDTPLWRNREAWLIRAALWLVLAISPKAGIIKTWRSQKSWAWRW